MKKKKFLLVVLIIFGLAQIFKPSLNEGVYDAKTDFLVSEVSSKMIKEKIQNSCYDCHSNITNYPWYDKITPINYWVNGHIKHAKGHLNFSEWTTYTTNDKLHAIDEMIEMIDNHEMPLKSYTIMHQEAKLNRKETQAILDWLSLLKIKYELTALPVQ